VLSRNTVRVMEIAREALSLKKIVVYSMHFTVVDLLRYKWEVHYM
jgi:hypothetical protein